MRALPFAVWTAAAGLCATASFENAEKLAKVFAKQLSVSDDGALTSLAVETVIKVSQHSELLNTDVMAVISGCSAASAAEKNVIKKCLALAAFNAIANEPKIDRTSEGVYYRFIKKYVSGNALLSRVSETKAERLIDSVMRVYNSNMVLFLDVICLKIALTDDATWTGAPYIAEMFLQNAETPEKMRNVAKQLALMGMYRPFSAAQILRAFAAGRTYVQYMIAFAEQADINILKSLSLNRQDYAILAQFDTFKVHFTASARGSDLAIRNPAYPVWCLAEFSPIFLLSRIVNGPSVPPQEYISLLLSMGSTSNMSMTECAIYAVLYNPSTDGAKAVVRALLHFTHDVNAEANLGGYSIRELLLALNLVSSADLASTILTPAAIAQWIQASY